MTAPGWLFDLYVLPLVVAFVVGACLVMWRLRLRDVEAERRQRRRQRLWRERAEEGAYRRALRSLGGTR